jgi:hypothetical protein
MVAWVFHPEAAEFAQSSPEKHRLPQAELSSQTPSGWQSKYGKIQSVVQYMQPDGRPKRIEAVKKITVYQGRYRHQRNQSTWTLSQMKCDEYDRRQ